VFTEGGCLGLSQAFDPGEADEGPLRELVEQMEAAIRERGWAA
jgi:hypothetical protein